MKKKHFLFVALLMLFFASCGEDVWVNPNTDPHGTSCVYTMKKHADKMFLIMRMECSNDTLCSSRLTFGSSSGELLNNCSPNDFEYRFVSDSSNEIVKKNSQVDLNVLPDDHVKFSLIDSSGAEKNYDVDLSPIIHSYTLRDDFIDIKIPENVWALYVDSAGSWQKKLRRDYENGILSYYIGKEREGKDSYYLFEGGFGIETPYGRDTVVISGSIYWK